MNLDRDIANRALTLVKAEKSNAKDANGGEYRSLVEGFPVLLRSAGLLQSSAFLKAKKSHPHGTLYKHLCEQMRAIHLLKEGEDLAEVLADSAKAPLGAYRIYCQMADRVAYWHKRVAQAYLGDPK